MYKTEKTKNMSLRKKIIYEFENTYFDYSHNHDYSDIIKKLRKDIKDKKL